MLQRHLMYKNGFSFLCGIALLTGSLFFLNAADKKPKSNKKPDKDLSEFMREKLAASNQILEGLATEDFKLIQDGAVKLQDLSQAEKWRISNDVMYKQHSSEFTRVAAQLQKQAKEGNLEGSALSWLQATMSCIECHKFVRSTLIAEQ
ncbi:MAG: hypothetical protein O2955_11285 [Planctomycetota bacterium]|nr:hypothetical protein [Planctomycetota bacterium]MDA1213096.1 hypothetical protein [Planctomycetota bacterium]